MPTPEDENHHGDRRQDGQLELPSRLRRQHDRLGSYLGTNKGSNLNSASNWPANLTLTRAQLTAAIAFPTSPHGWQAVPSVVRGGQPTATPTLAGFAAAPANPANANAVLIGNENRYNFADTYQIYPAYDYVSNHTSIADLQRQSEGLELTFARSL